MKGNTDVAKNGITLPPVISIELASLQGLGEWEIRNASDWHRAMANAATGIYRERHFQLAAKLTMVADGLR